ncbi:glycosyltransferase family 2 protein [Pelosinus fermentans]|uniref:Glycosyl transferase family 2 n=1 Tax=Pelosinus fermentans JBW45 TaxID=1192197 RepID=I9DGL9_9FIRM|nr:glycosyltransferase family 2 protein [Pelosinus fermentans]AJQ26587.1 glycosyl transferase family 2 [Pelosinus fermentans JBW45]
MENKRCLDASVIIPVYNQAESLQITLNFFKFQSYDSKKYEIIVVDDGSTDGLRDKIREDKWPQLPCSISYIYSENKGRAVARNKGAAIARGKRLIFCDADRFPDRDYIKNYIVSSSELNKIAIVGSPWDYFGHIKYLLGNHCGNISIIRKYSRLPLYYLKVKNLYDAKGSTNSGIAWATFLVGNSCVKAEDFETIGGFDEDFNTWGFEHFEFALRLQKIGVKFRNCPEISSFHIPHARGEGHYKSAITNSIQLFKAKHPNCNLDSLRGFLFGEMSLQDFELHFCGTQTTYLGESESIYYNVV